MEEKVREKHLLILNYCMDEKDPILSQQVQVVLKLLPMFDRVTVITGRIGVYPIVKNLNVFNTKWKPGYNLSNAFRFFLTTVPVLIKDRPDVIFSHMTEVQSFLLSFFSKLLKIRHFLWYAHTSKSFFLKWNHVWLNGIITSTSGSCPITSKKVIPIGQAVSAEQFLFKKNKSYALKKIVHIGRSDLSKNINLIIDSVIEIRKKFGDLTLTLIGTPSTEYERRREYEIINKFNQEVSNGWLIFKKAISRNEVPGILHENDIFIHAYLGSLDKTLIEATLSGIPVVSTNNEYKKIFGSWGSYDGANIDLNKELEFVLNAPSAIIDVELMRRYEIAKNEHSLNAWVQKLYVLLN